MPGHPTVGLLVAATTSTAFWLLLAHLLGGLR